MAHFDQNIAHRLMGDLQRDFGMTPQQAAGVVGSLAFESGGFRTLQEQGVPYRGGWGYAQWTGPRRTAFDNWVRQNGLDPSSYEANYGFLSQEFRDPLFSRWLQPVYGATDTASAARDFTGSADAATGFLRPGIPHIEQRIGEAQAVLDSWTNRLGTNDWGQPLPPSIPSWDTQVAPLPPVRDLLVDQPYPPDAGVSFDQGTFPWDAPAYPPQRPGETYPLTTLWPVGAEPGTYRYNEAGGYDYIPAVGQPPAGNSVWNGTDLTGVGVTDWATPLWSQDVGTSAPGVLDTGTGVSQSSRGLTSLGGTYVYNDAGGYDYVPAVGQPPASAGVWGGTDLTGTGTIDWASPSWNGTNPPAVGVTDWNAPLWSQDIGATATSALDTSAGVSQSDQGLANLGGTYVYNDAGGYDYVPAVGQPQASPSVGTTDWASPVYSYDWATPAQSYDWAAPVQSYDWASPVHSYETPAPVQLGGSDYLSSAATTDYLSPVSTATTLTPSTSTDYLSPVSNTDYLNPIQSYDYSSPVSTGASSTATGGSQMASGIDMLAPIAGSTANNVTFNIPTGSSALNFSSGASGVADAVAAINASISGDTMGGHSAFMNRARQMDAEWRNNRAREAGAREEVANSTSAYAATANSYNPQYNTQTNINRNIANLNPQSSWGWSAVSGPSIPFNYFTPVF